MKRHKPLFIVFEGIDGSGKTTLSKRLYKHLSSKETPVLLDHEPTEGYWGKMLRNMLSDDSSNAVELLELFIKDREDDVEINIKPALKNGKTVILDRYYYSNAAYQGAMGISPDSIIRENQNKNFPKPDRVYLVDIKPELAIERILRRNTKTEIFEKIRFLEKVREIYHNIADETFVILDGSKTINELKDIIKKDIKINFPSI